jgi:hypothetical protein
MTPISGDSTIEKMNHPRPDLPRLEAKIPTAIENKTQKMTTTIDYRLRDMTDPAKPNLDQMQCLFAASQTDPIFVKVVHKDGS